jgi:hypothetical protein
MRKSKGMPMNAKSNKIKLEKICVPRPVRPFFVDVPLFVHPVSIGASFDS